MDDDLLRELEETRELLEHAELLNRVLLATTASLDVNEVLQRICEEIASVFHAPQVGIALLNAERTMMRVAAEYSASNTSTVGELIPVEGNPLTQYVLDHHVPMYIVNTATDDRLGVIGELLHRQSIVSMLIIPIWSLGQIIGTLGVATYWEQDYSEEEIALIEQVAHAASSALDHARLYSQMEQELAARRAAEAVIAAQEAQLIELSTPILAIDDQVVMLPLIGQVSAARAELVIGSLLRGVTQHRARIVILDVTGMTVIDHAFAEVLARAALSVRLLGAQVILTGIRPDVAEMLISLAIDLSHIQTYSTLQQGIAVALSRKNQRASSAPRR